jgi:hypothetical protein
VEAGRGSIGRAATGQGCRDSATLFGQGSFLCRTVAQSHCSARTGHSGKQRQRDCARVLAQASTCGVRKIESPMGHGLDQEADSDAIYIQNCYIYISLKASNCHAMPCSARLGSACDTISSSFCFCFSLDLPVQYLPTRWIWIGGAIWGRARLHQPVQCSRLTSHAHQSGRDSRGFTTRSDQAEARGVAPSWRSR